MSRDSRVVLITGCSSGFGKELVPAFLERGWRVIATLRDAQARREIFAVELQRYGERLAVADLDITDSVQRESIRRLIEQRFSGRLDCLVNNAGIGLFGAAEDFTEEELRRQFEVNFFGLVFFTKLLLPTLRQNRGRIINISSVVGYVGQPYASAYSATKHALEGFSEALLAEVAPFGVQVSLVEPGSHRTEFRSKSMWAKGSSDPSSPYFEITQQYRAYKERTQATSRSSSGVVLATVRAAEAKRPGFHIRCGSDAKAIFWLKRLLPERLFLLILVRGFPRFISDR